jgi:hypothetical protein
VLEKLGAAERARWPKSEDELDDAQKLVDAVRGLGTVALLARVPRPAVWVYSQLATAATWYIREDIEMDGFGPEYGTGGGLDMDFSDTVLDAADIVSRAAWSSPISRRLWLARRLHRLDRKIEASRTVPCPCGAR